MSANVEQINIKTNTAKDKAVLTIDKDLSNMDAVNKKATYLTKIEYFQAPKEISEDRDDVVEKSIGTLGPWHIWVCLAIFLVKFPVAWHQLSIVFLAPPVNFSCATNETDRCSEKCLSHIFDRSDFVETIITEWDLVCDRAYLANLAQTVTMLGILSGNMIFGYFSDRFGRRSPLIVAVTLQFISGACAALTPWFFVFLLARFISALATGGTMVASFVLIMELVGSEWRTPFGILYQIPFNCGHLTLPVFAYFLRDWRYLQMAISTLSIFLLVYYWILPESPRWLLTVGKVKEAVAMLENAAHHNHLPTSNIKEDVHAYMQKDLESTTIQEANILDLVRTPILRVYTLCICFNWLVTGLCFYGVAQFIGQLGGNIFVNVALSAVIQIPGTLISIWAVKTLGRRNTLIVANIVAGISCILIGFVPSDPAWFTSMLCTMGMFGSSICFPTVYIYSGELFPTTIRNIGVGTSSMCARIGSMAAPFIASLVVVQSWLPPIIFGIAPLIGAALCYKLPETLNCKLPDTIEEAEQLQK